MAPRKTSDVARTKLACVVASVVAQSGSGALGGLLLEVEHVLEDASRSPPATSARSSCLLGDLLAEVPHALGDGLQVDPGADVLSVVVM